MKPIETNFGGYRFRSRLEARYAVFFNSLGITWEYEVEGFVLSNGECYLPDFWLPTFSGGTWVEVKGKELTDGERKNCISLCLDTKSNVWIAQGTPDFRCYEVYYYHDGDVVHGDGIPNADQAEDENRMYAMSAYGKAGGMINLEYRDLLGNKLPLAVKAAKSARFEHGEKP